MPYEEQPPTAEDLPQTDGGGESAQHPFTTLENIGLDGVQLMPLDRVAAYDNEDRKVSVEEQLKRVNYNVDSVQGRYDRAVKATIDFMNGKFKGTTGSDTGTTSGAGADTVLKADKFGGGPAKPGPGHNWKKAPSTTRFGDGSDNPNEGTSYGAGTFKELCDAGVFGFAIYPGHNSNTPAELVKAAPKLNQTINGKKPGQLIVKHGDKYAICTWIDNGPGAEGGGRYLDLLGPAAEYLGVSLTDVEWDFVGTGDTIATSSDAGGASTLGQAVVNLAMKQRGKPYGWGDTGPNSFDCSGLVVWCFMKIAGISMPRVAADQAADHGTKIDRNKMVPGDCVYFAYDGGKGKVHHVGIYIGNGEFVHAPKTGDVVKVSKLTSRHDFACAKRHWTQKEADDYAKKHGGQQSASANKPSPQQVK